MPLPISAPEHFLSAKSQADLDYISHPNQDTRPENSSPSAARRLAFGIKVSEHSVYRVGVCWSWQRASTLFEVSYCWKKFNFLLAFFAHHDSRIFEN